MSFALAFLLGLTGTILGAIAFAQVDTLRSTLKRLEAEIARLKLQLAAGGLPPPTQKERPPSAAVPALEREATAPRPEPSMAAEPAQSRAAAEAVGPEFVTGPQRQVAAHGPVVPPPSRVPPGKIGPRVPSFELQLGTRWIAWVGAVMLLVGVGLFLKFAYDNNWIGPRGRLTIGVLGGVAALILADYLRRQNYRVLFEVLTGCGLAMFYICTFFAMQVYHLAGPGVAMGCAALTTGAAIVLSVAHDAVSVAIVGLIGGFLSPVILSTGQNHPYALFTYVAILDLVALGVAYFRRWRGLDVLAFAGTAILYMGWYAKFYAGDQMTPALLYTSLFYLMFLLIPTIYGLVRRVPESIEGLTLVVANAGFSLYCYYLVLYQHHRQILGFVVLVQAALVFLLFQTWLARVKADTKTGESFLIITLALVTMAIPLELRLYGIPIAWSLEGALFSYLGVRYRKFTCRLAGLAALLLAMGGLFQRLPLHRAAFLPVFNVPFGSWMLVIAAASLACYLLYKNKQYVMPEERYFPIAPFLLAYFLGCLLLTLEVSAIWDYSTAEYRRNYRADCLVALWALIPLGTTWVLVRRRLPAYLPLAWVVYAVSLLFFLFGMAQYRLPSPWLLMNYTFLSKLLLVVAFWVGANLMRQIVRNVIPRVLESVGHVLMAILIAAEFVRWADHSDFLSRKMAIGLISAVWAAQALALIWIGLMSRQRFRRYLGFTLFGITVAKTLFMDTLELDQVYRIVSWLASGILLLAAAWFYQRYSAILLGEGSEERENEHTESG
ncbi:MAG: DUF2339 domain-containing protein [Candidatus Hydrogenedentes bacterium]|nr:DUF2339 domain-containing protein [Candidatus Hydrogenedentota bacterium]